MIVNTNPKAFGGVNVKVNQYDVLRLENNKLRLRVCRRFEVKLPFSSPDVITQFCINSLKLDTYAEEYAYLFVLDPKCTVLGIFELSHGAIDTTILSVRELMIRVLLCGGIGFVVVHNHPSGYAEPSGADIENARVIQDAANLMHISFFDNLIISKDHYLSFKEENLL